MSLLIIFSIYTNLSREYIAFLIKFHNECITILYCVSNKKLITVNKNFYFEWCYEILLLVNIPLS